MSEGMLLPLSCPSQYYPLSSGVNVLGIDSQNTPMSLRRKVWKLLAGEWKTKILEKLAKECTLDQLDVEIDHSSMEPRQVGF